ncbi:hypothetical protein [Nocardia mikamii]|uniref:hypothetical protein n=1 Tax=Nocardia mikamii TaxID=508464 RepID=UPI000B07D5EB|nr:hypothetical protein [Nocardia mikamii]
MTKIVSLTPAGVSATGIRSFGVAEQRRDGDGITELVPALGADLPAGAFVAALRGVPS